MLYNTLCFTIKTKHIAKQCGKLHSELEKIYKVFYNFKIQSYQKKFQYFTKNNTMQCSFKVT